jgi:hypothetical protein
MESECRTCFGTGGWFCDIEPGSEECRKCPVDKEKFLCEHGVLLCLECNGSGVVYFHEGKQMTYEEYILAQGRAYG